jgi:hypothetical protein
LVEDIVKAWNQTPTTIAITIPHEICKELKIEAGTFKVRSENGRIVLEVVK